MFSRSRTPRGMSLIEVMIAMGVLAVGLLAMWNLHVLGLSSTAAGRRQTLATAIAGELVSGLERLAFTDPLIQETGTAGPNPPSPFGALVDGFGNVTSGSREWNDSSPVPGVRRSSEMRELAEASVDYRRRWTVWSVYQGNGGGAAGGPTTNVKASSTVPAAKVIAVSVTWNDPPFRRPREVVQYAVVPNPALPSFAISGTSASSNSGGSP